MYAYERTLDTYSVAMIGNLFKISTNFRLTKVPCNVTHARCTAHAYVLQGHTNRTAIVLRIHNVFTIIFLEQVHSTNKIYGMYWRGLLRTALTRTGPVRNRPNTMGLFCTGTAQ